MFCLVLLNTQSYACMCAGTSDSVEEIYNKVDGIYYVVISSITQSNDNYQGGFKSVVNLEIELTIFKTYKGDEFGIILGKGTGRLPYYNENGQLERGGSSCDTDFTFGDYYVIIKNKDEIVDLGLCSKNILEHSKWQELKELKNQDLKII